MATAGPTTEKTAGNDETGEENKEKPTGNDNANFECNICLDTAKDAVISMCGHLFCWPCLHQWLEMRPNQKLCPVCKAGISKEKVIPLYGRGSANKKDPRDQVPPRPAGQRSEPERGNFGMGPGFGFGDGGGGFQFHFGIGAFPFTLFTTMGNNLGHNNMAAGPAARQYEDQMFLSKVFMAMAFLFIFWLLIV